MASGQVGTAERRGDEEKKIGAEEKDAPEINWVSIFEVSRRGEAFSVGQERRESKSDTFLL